MLLSKISRLNKSTFDWPLGWTELLVVEKTFYLYSKGDTCIKTTVYIQEHVRAKSAKECTISASLCGITQFHKIWIALGGPALYLRNALSFSSQYDT